MKHVKLYCIIFLIDLQKQPSSATSAVPKQADKYWSLLGMIVSSAQTSYFGRDLRTLPFWMRLMSFWRKLREFPSLWAPHTSGASAVVQGDIVGSPVLAVCARTALHAKQLVLSRSTGQNCSCMAVRQTVHGPQSLHRHKPTYFCLQISFKSTRIGPRIRCWGNFRRISHTPVLDTCLLFSYHLLVLELG